ncbi:MAG TPA: carbonic anhydrase family protein [Aquificales bacterium]|nr:carbonic anhydrase family protein [Aquificales bacterium]
MRKLLLGGLLAFSVSTFAGGHSGGKAVHWGYEGDIAPQYWGDLSPAFIMCKIGKNQSPIDISKEGLTKACLQPLEVNYSADAKVFLNNGHTVKVETAGESYIVLDGRKFYLRQFHFHTPSEHTINGKHYPMEVHFVHTDRYGNIAVVGVLFKVGKRNPALDRLIPYMPYKVGEKNYLPLKFNPVYLFPQNRDYYRYSGSLTTPPCSEGVRWVVFKEVVEVSPEQLEAFERAIGVENNRPVQPLNARRILY